MIPTATVIPQSAFPPSPTLGALLGPLAGCVLLAAVVALAFVAGATIRTRRAKGAVRRPEPAHIATATAVARRPAA
jgi:hypothetical protein